jgi:hypothetical protein
MNPNNIVSVAQMPFHIWNHLAYLSLDLSPINLYCHTLLCHKLDLNHLRASHAPMVCSVELEPLAFCKSGLEQIQQESFWPPTIQPTQFLLARL